MRKKITRFITFIELSILFLSFLLFLIANRETLDFTAHKISKEYNIEYKKISGTLISGISLDDVTYKKRLLAKKVVIDWKVLPLLYRKLSFSDLELIELDIDTLKLFLKDHQSSQKERKSEENSLPFMSIESDKTLFSIKPYEDHDRKIKIENFFVKIKDLYTDLKNFKIKEFKTLLKSSFGKIAINGYAQDKKLFIDSLDVKELDIQKIVNSNLFPKDKNSSKSKKSSKPLPIDGIVFKKISLDLNPYRYREYELYDLKFLAYSGFFDMKYLYFDRIDTDIKTNAADLNLTGRIDKNKLFAKIKTFLKNSYLKRYTKKVDFNAFNPVVTNLEASQKEIRSTLYLHANDFLKDELKQYEIKLDDSKTVIFYDISKNLLKMRTKADIETLYTKKIEIENSLDLNKTVKFFGNIAVKGYRNLPKEAEKILRDLNISYKGDKKYLKGKLISSSLKGDFNIEGYKKMTLKLLAKDLNYNDLKASCKVNSLIDFANINNSKNIVKIESNYLNIDSKIKLGTPVRISSTILPSNSSSLKDIKLFPLCVDTNITDKLVSSKLSGKIMNGMFTYKTKQKSVDAGFHIDSSTVKLKGDLKEKLKLSADINSLRELQDEILKVYKFKKLPVDAQISFEITTDPKTFKSRIDINSPWFLYEYEKNRFLVTENFKSLIYADPKQIDIKNYSFNIIEKRFFAKKESNIYLNEQNITIDRFYINDKAFVKGFYKSREKKGVFRLKAKRFKYKANEGKITLNSDISLFIDKKSQKAEGKIDIEDALVTFKPPNNYQVNDKDIIIINKNRQSKKDKKDDNLSIDIKITNKKPVVYKTDDIEIEANVDLTLWKEAKKSLEILGMTKILKGKVVKENKLFKIDHGELLFGGDPSNPYLNIDILHEKRPYEITITVTGTLESPVILFSSDPYLSQSDILSLILFGTTSSQLTSGNGSASNQAISMFGNALAKDLADSLGIKLDRLALNTKEDGSIGVEIGKKVSKNVTIIYRNDVVSTIVIQYEHSPRFETDITIKPSSSGIDFIYKKEY